MGKQLNWATTTKKKTAYLVTNHITKTVWQHHRQRILIQNNLVCSIFFPFGSVLLLDYIFVMSDLCTVPNSLTILDIPYKNFTFPDRIPLLFLFLPFPKHYSIIHVFSVSLQSSHCDFCSLVLFCFYLFADFSPCIHLLYSAVHVGVNTFIPRMVSCWNSRTSVQHNVACLYIYLLPMWYILSRATAAPRLSSQLCA